MVADFGCGEALIAQSITNKVYSFDLIAKNKFVTACNMAKVGFQFYFILEKGYLRNFGTCSYVTVHPLILSVHPSIGTTGQLMLNLTLSS